MEGSRPPFPLAPCTPRAWGLHSSTGGSRPRPPWRPPYPPQRVPQKARHPHAAAEVRVSHRLAQMSDRFASVMSVGETAGSVQYEQQTSARGDLELSDDEHRRLTLYSQGFLGAAARRGGVPGMLRRVRAVQLDTISVLARSHELVAYARLGPVGRDAVEAAFWQHGG